MPVKSTKIAVLLLSITLLGACTSAPERREQRETPHATGLPSNLQITANDVLFQAISLVGTPYHYGGNSPQSGFDCSGLITYVFLHSAGLKLPRTTAELIEIDAPKVNRSRLYPGDLVYFSTRGNRVSHIGIYVGERRFVHAPSTGGTVRMDHIDAPYWQKHYVEAKRVLLRE